MTNVKRRSSLIVLIILVMFTVSACGTLYQAGEIENKETDTYITVNVEDNKEEEETIIEVDPEEIQQPATQEEEVTLEEEIEESEDYVEEFESDTSYDLSVDLDILDNTETSWSFRRNEDHIPVTGYYDIDLSLFGAYFRNMEAEEEKVIYLTFDEGYEYGFTPKILETLKENDVKATFFVTKAFIDSEPDLILQMVADGHTVGNHSATHPSMPTLSDNELLNEITSTAAAYEELTGQIMDPFFRPPSGKYSERSLYLTRKAGYRTIFWSMAYNDWDVNNQPGADAAYEHVLTNYHNGSIILLHAVSESNADALDSIIKSLKALGYRFGSLYELE